LNAETRRRAEFNLSNRYCTITISTVSDLDISVAYTKSCGISRCIRGSPVADGNIFTFGMEQLDLSTSIIKLGRYPGRGGTVINSLSKCRKIITVHSSRDVS